ncbi:MAG: alpha-L-fucosidase [Ferruginibacter sp.]|nr:alpha-L-fucosidase [Ferruginibacter sp.]
MINKSNCLFIFCFWVTAPLIAQITVSDSTSLVNGMTRQKVQDPIVLNPTTINQLLAPDAMQSPGIKQFGPQGKLNAKKFWLMRFTGNKKIAWNITVPKAGTYAVDFLINSKAGTSIKLTGPANSFLFIPAEKGWQRAQATGVLQLPAGKGTITLQLAETKDTIDIKSIELVNVSEKKNIEQRARKFKGDATWMKDAGYGIMLQVGGWAYPAKGDKKPWPGFAEDFDVKGFVDKIRDMGGKYIVWSATWSDYLFPAPIKAIAGVLPARVSKRDLLGDIIKECQKYDIRVMMYYHLGHDHKEVLLAKGWKDSTAEDYKSRQHWLNLETKIFTEIGNRYGKGLNAVFLDDGCVWYPADFEKLGAALKAGNPKRLICYNPWIGANLTPFQDFYCGEGFDGKETPYQLEDGFIAEGPQKGLQLFGNFIFDGPDWGINKPNTVIRAPRRWTVDKIVEMTKRLEKERYSVAINLLMYEDGTIGEASYNMLKEAAIKLKRGKWADQ